MKREKKKLKNEE
jgi:hypothetical protein